MGEMIDLRQGYNRLEVSNRTRRETMATFVPGGKINVRLSLANAAELVGISDT